MKMYLEEMPTFLRGTVQDFRRLPITSPTSPTMGLDTIIEEEHPSFSYKFFSDLMEVRENMILMGGYSFE